MAEAILHSIWLYFTLGIFVGANLGFLAFAIIHAAKRADKYESTITRRLNQASRGGSNHGHH
jgi:hypothetical protein